MPEKLRVYFQKCYGIVRKYVCQTWVKYHLQIIIGVCFDLLEVPDGGVCFRITQTVAGEL